MCSLSVLCTCLETNLSLFAVRKDDKHLCVLVRD